MDLGTSVAVVGSAFAAAATILGIVHTVYRRQPESQVNVEQGWVEPLNRVERTFRLEVDNLRDRVHGVEVSIGEIKFLTASLQEIKDMIGKLEDKEASDILRLEGKIDRLTEALLGSLKGS